MDEAGTSNVVVFGVSPMSEMIHYYLTHDTGHTVVAFAVDQAFVTGQRFCGLPVVAFEQVEAAYPPDSHRLAMLVGFRHVNRLRADRFAMAKAKGYRFVSYVCSSAVVWPGLSLGENCFVLEGAMVQPGARIGHNVFLAPRVLIGRHAVIGDHCFLASRSSVLEGASLDSCCLLGANSTVGAAVTVGRSCVLGAGVYLDRDASAREVHVGPRSVPVGSGQLDSSAR